MGLFLLSGQRTPEKLPKSLQHILTKVLDCLVVPTSINQFRSQILNILTGQEKKMVSINRGDHLKPRCYFINLFQNSSSLRTLACSLVDKFYVYCFDRETPSVKAKQAPYNSSVILNLTVLSFLLASVCKHMGMCNSASLWFS